jgi:type III pantothenate kinase
MKLLIDSGNTRIKWAMVQEMDWLCSGILPVEKAGELSQHLVAHCDQISNGLHHLEQVWVSNVAGEEVESHIRNIFARESIKTHFIVAREEQCGVHNGYTRPGQLGSDRWAALVGAWHLMKGECLVVNCGTATTIDALSGQGEFMGGVILPGVDLMLNSLCDTTAKLMAGEGKYVLFPKNTADAMFSGVIQASCGAIQRQHALLDNDGAPVVLSGGAAGILQEHMQMPLRIVDNLVLQGMLIIAQEASEP